MKVSEQISHNLKRLRLKKTMSQRDLAEKTGIDEKFISQLENKPRHVSTRTLQRLAEGLDVSCKEFFNRDGSTNSKRKKPSKELIKGLDEAIKVLKIHRSGISD